MLCSDIHTMAVTTVSEDVRLNELPFDVTCVLKKVLDQGRTSVQCS